MRRIGSDRCCRAHVMMFYGASLATIVGIVQPTKSYAQQSATPDSAPIKSTQQAQGAEPSNIEEIVVTAQRRAQSAQEVPASLEALSGDMLVERQITTIARLASAIPNMQMSQAYGAGDPPDFSIRGISTADISQNQSRPIAIYIDEGIRQMPMLEAMPLFDVDHVEVLRGPQGALYGKNATGGAVSIITKEPDFDDIKGYLSAGYGNFDRYDTEGAIQIPIVSDQLAVRLAYTYTEDDGVTKLVTSDPALQGQNLDQTETLGVRASVRYKPTSDLDITLRYNHYRDGGRTAGVYAGSDINFAAVGFPIYDTFPGALRQGLGFFENDQNYVGHRNLTDDGLNSQIKWSITPDISLLSLTTYDAGEWLYTVNADGLPLDFLGNQTLDAKNTNQFVQELRLSGNTGPSNWVLGAFYSHDSVEIYHNEPNFSDPRCGTECDFGLGGIGFVQTNQFRQERDSYAAYGRLEYAFTDVWSLAGGLRWSHDEIGVKNYTAYLGSVQAPEFITTIEPTSESRSFSNVSGEATLTFHPTHSFLAYASFKQGYRTGAFNAQAYSSLSEITVAPPETANSWETGFKSDFLDRRVLFNLTGFYTLYKNQQVLSAEIVDGVLLLPLLSIPKSRIYGAETDVTFRPTNNLTLSFSGGYADSMYTEGVVGGQSIVGNSMATAAKWSGTLGADWKIVKFDESSLNLHADAAFQSFEYFNVKNTPGVDDAGHTVTNVQLSYDLQKWTFSLWSTNLFDRHYITEALDTQGLGHNYEIRGLPRMFGIRFRRDF